MTELTWKQRYDRMKRHYGWTDAVISEMIGNAPNTVSRVVGNAHRAGTFPRMLRLAIIIYEMENGLGDDEANVKTII